MKKSLLFTAAFLFAFLAKSQWLNQNAGFTNDTLGFYEMSLPNEHTAWAICYDGKFGLGSGRLVLDFTRTTNGGNTWIPGKMGNDSTLEFSNISAINGKRAWVAMHKLGGITGGGLYKTKDGGVTWRQSKPGVIFDNNSFPDFVHFKNKNKGVAMGDPNNGYFEVYTTTNGGKKWKKVPQHRLPASLPNEYGWISGYAAVGNTIWFGTTLGRMYKSTNFGKDWTVNVVDPDGKFINEIAFNDDRLHGVAHLRNGAGTFLYSTTDGGLSWTNLGQPVNWKSSRITAVPGTNAFVATSVNGFDRGSSVSYDNGVTWTIIENGAPKAVARFYNANVGYAGGFFVTGPPFNGGIYKSQIVFETPECGKANPVKTARTRISAQASPVTEKMSTDQVSIYPTPARDVINISLGDIYSKGASLITVISSDGRVVDTKKTTGLALVRIDASRMSPGIYIIRVFSNGETISKTVSIAR